MHKGPVASETLAKLEGWDRGLKQLAAVLAGSAILWIVEPAFPDSLVPETFHGPKGNYYRIPPGYLWEVGAYNYTIQIPVGAEACTDDWTISGHGPAIGPSDRSCLDVFKHPAAVIYAGCSHFCFSDQPIPKRTLMKENCEIYRIMTTSIVVDGQSFYKCWGKMSDSDGKKRYMDYFTYSEPNPGLELHVYIFCPSHGNCSRWVRKWEKLIFNNLHIHWSDGDTSETTGNKGDGQSK